MTALSDRVLRDIDELSLRSCMECFEDAPATIRVLAKLVPADQVRRLSPQWTRTKAIEGRGAGLICRKCLARDTIREAENVKLRQQVGAFCDALGKALKPGGAR